MSVVRQPARAHPDVLRDESRRMGHADAVAWPTQVDEVSALLAEAARTGTPVTFQGARTGIVGGAVPDGGLVVNLARLDLLGTVRRDTPAGPLVRVGAGFPLEALRRALHKAAPDLYFAPDPTEGSASLGGMAACNASGARSFALGAMRRHIHGLTVVLADGTVATLTRGRERAAGRGFRIAGRDGHVAVAGELPLYTSPAVKNAAGYAIAPDMELVDLFIGSEGTLGAIAELELRLLPAPAVCWGLLCFGADEARVLDAADALREAAPRPVALEYFGGRALTLLRQERAGDRQAPSPPDGAGAALYVELMAESDAAAEAAAAGVLATLEGAGLSADAAWLATDARERKRLLDFRHAVPETVNTVVDRHRRDHPEVTKVGTDFALPAAAFREVLARQCRDAAAAGLPPVVFGHVGDCHVHINLLPRTPGALAAARSLVLEWARGVAAVGGSVAAEHGLGKLKAALLPVMYGETAVAAMRRLKRLFDPDERLGRGTLFPPAAPAP